MLPASNIITPVIHATVFKAANSNTRPQVVSARAEALLDRWLDDERKLRENTDTPTSLDTVPEHFF